MELILTTAYWPPISWFAAMIGSQTWVLDQFENYQKQTFRSRCRIVGANGVQDLIIPVVRQHGSKTQIREVGMDQSRAWRRNHLGAVVSAYRSSAFFEYYQCDIEAFYKMPKTDNLFEFNLQILDLCLKMLGLNRQIPLSGEFMGPANESLWESPKEKAVPYYQVFSQKHGFIPYLSILDLICNEGPNSLSILKTQAQAQKQVKI